MSCRFCLTDGLRNLTRRGTVVWDGAVCGGLREPLGSRKRCRGRCLRRLRLRRLGLRWGTGKMAPFGATCYPRVFPPIMQSSAPRDIVCAHSPDSDDAYMFYALATKKIRSRLVNVKHHLDDIETLNRKALEGVYELTAISYHAYPYVADKYQLMASGSSVGDGYGRWRASQAICAARAVA